MSWLSAPLSPLLMAASLAIVFGAGIVRGFAGFGFSALSVAGLALIVSPAQVVPAIFVLEVLASISLLRSAARDIDWHWLSWLIAGNVLCLPLGILLLAWLPETPLRLLIGALLLLAAVLLRSGFSLALAPSRPVRLGVGMASGFVNGVAAIGGIAVAVMLSTSQIAPAVMRATLIALFLFTDLYALACSALVSLGTEAPTALLGADTLRWALWLAPAMLAGIWAGQRSFVGVSPAQFRRHVLNLLMLIAAISVLRALVELVGQSGS
ncbi:TSUP family transporter [Rhizobacter fulvus]